MTAVTGINDHALNFQTERPNQRCFARARAAGGLSDLGDRRRNHNRDYLFGRECRRERGRVNLLRGLLHNLLRRDGLDQRRRIHNQSRYRREVARQWG